MTPDLIRTIDESIDADVFYSLHEIIATTGEDEVFRSCLQVKQVVEEGWAAMADDRLVNLASRLPEELPSCFLAARAKVLSPVTGWKTEHGIWKRKYSFAAGPGFGMIEPATTVYNGVAWARTILTFRPKAKVRSGSDFAMAMYSVISSDNGKAQLEEDMTFCRVFRTSKEKGKRLSDIEASAIPLWRSLFGHEADPADVYLNMGAVDSPEGDTEAIGNGEDGSTKKRGRSDVWLTYSRLYTKDPNVMFGVCHQCGRMYKLTGGSSCGTSSLSTHNMTCLGKKHGASM